jgi:hypothetical protein
MVKLVLPVIRVLAAKCGGGAAAVIERFAAQGKPDSSGRADRGLVPHFC